MSGILDNDHELAHEGRSETLQDDPSQGLEVTAPLRERIIQKLVDRLEEENVAQQVTDVWRQGNADRAEWLTRQDEYLYQFDEFIDPIYESATDWGSTLHLPTILTLCKTFHARFHAALMSVDPPFVVRARKGANADRAVLVEDLMRYTLKDWANEYTGVAETVDRWLWDWVTSGTAIMKARWDKQFTSFMDVETRVVPTVKFQFNPQTGQSEPVPTQRLEEEEVERTITKFDGPCLERINIEDLLIVGGEGDPQKADYVIERRDMTASELYTLVDRGIFDADAVEKTIKAGESHEEHEQTGQIKQTRKEISGVNGGARTYDIPRYEVLEAYIKVDVTGRGIDSDVIVWINPDSRTILRATYLYRMMPNGMKPYFKIDFYKRNGTEYGAGLVELTYSLAKEIDAMHNIRVDTGILTSLPWGFYRPSSTMNDEKLPIEPGTLVPVDNPGQDVFFPNLGNRTAFGFNEEQALQTHIERLTSISDISLGIIAGQGATRTATGTRAIIGEANANLDIFLQRMNRGWKSCLKYMFAMMQIHLPEGLDFRVLGDDGNSYWRRIESREEIAGMYDFELESNSSNSNKQIQLETANLILQTSFNPLALQLGLVSPLELYEAIKNMYQINGVRDISKYLRKPSEITRTFTPEEIANRLLAGIDVPLDPTQDLQGFVTYVQAIMSDDELLGQFSQEEVIVLVTKMQEAVALMQAMEQMRAQAANLQQQQSNTQQGTLGQSFEQQAAPNATPVGTEGAG